jgi:hypothetical protein
MDVTIVPKFAGVGWCGRAFPTESPEAGGVGGSWSGVPWSYN